MLSTVDECRRLVNACPPHFRALVQGALATGCRFGELALMVAADFNAEAGTVTIRLSKAGKVRHVAFADEGRALFSFSSLLFSSLLFSSLLFSSLLFSSLLFSSLLFSSLLFSSLSLSDFAHCERVGLEEPGYRMAPLIDARCTRPTSPVRPPCGGAREDGCSRKRDRQRPRHRGRRRLCPSLPRIQLHPRPGGVATEI